MLSMPDWCNIQKPLQKFLEICSENIKGSRRCLQSIHPFDLFDLLVTFLESSPSECPSQVLKFISDSFTSGLPQFTMYGSNLPLLSKEPQTLLPFPSAMVAVSCHVTDSHLQSQNHEVITPRYPMMYFSFSLFPTCNSVFRENGHCYFQLLLCYCIVLNPK